MRLALAAVMHSVGLQDNRRDACPAALEASRFLRAVASVAADDLEFEYESMSEPPTAMRISSSLAASHDPRPVSMPLSRYPA